MLSQLIVIDFTGGYRRFLFSEFSGSPERAITFYLDRFCDQRAYYLLNYDREHSNKAKLQLAFLYAEHSEVARKPFDAELKAYCEEYAAKTNSYLSIVNHGDSFTLCEFTPNDDTPPIDKSPEWLLTTMRQHYAPTRTDPAPSSQ